MGSLQYLTFTGIQLVISNTTLCSLLIAKYASCEELLTVLKIRKRAGSEAGSGEIFLPSTWCAIEEFAQKFKLLNLKDDLHLYTKLSNYSHLPYYL